MIRMLLIAGVLLSAVAALAESPSGGDIRPPVHAGSWYPADPAELRALIEKDIAAARGAGKTGAEPSVPVLAVIAPHAGYAYSGAVAAKAFASLEGTKVRRFWLLGGSHRMGYEGIALPGAAIAAFGTPLGPLPVDREAVRALAKLPGFGGPAAAHDGEHSLEMEAIFLAARHPGTPIVPLLVGRIGDDLALRRIASALNPLLREGDVIVVSSDFTHYGPRYGYVPFTSDVPARLDALADFASAALSNCDSRAFAAHLASTGDTICGSEPLRLLLALLPSGARGAEAGRATSGAGTGDWSNSVTYLAEVFRAEGGWAAMAHDLKPPIEEARGMNGPLDATGRRDALTIARRTLEIYLPQKRVPTDVELGVPASGPLREPGAAFVTLEKTGMLRGCIGHIMAVEPLWACIRDNAVAAAVHDSRFPPVTREELGAIELSVSVLTAPRPVPSPGDFIVGRHGIILEVNGRRALFLPQVAPEQGWSREQTFAALCRKAGLPPDAWRAPEAKFSVFEAQVFGEEELR